MGNTHDTLHLLLFAYTKEDIFHRANTSKLPSALLGQTYRVLGWLYFLWVEV